MLALFSFGLTAPERKALPQGNLAPGGNAPVPVDAEAEFLMGMGQCAVWCSANVAPWKTKCGWGSGYCSACSECSEHTIPHCGYWCPLHSGSWAEKYAARPTRPAPCTPKTLWGRCLPWLVLSEMRSDTVSFFGALTDTHTWVSDPTHAMHPTNT